ncbi:TPA: methionine adenosyltransferase [Candidatus Taylorbacteria bacterium]|nr:methionine adenosyltransferase [Candidatus Taylorbacteria bacterium]
MLKTAESVSIAHPDKVCDQISDAVLDACLAQDSQTRAAIEVLGGHGIITVCGELTTRAHINIRKIAQEVYRDCGYSENIGVTVNVVEQSPEIGHGVDNEGAGDQGIMVGYACDETPELLPLEVVLARKLTRAMGANDGKSQVTVENGKVLSVLTSVCNADYGKKSELVKVVKKEIEPLLAPGLKLDKVWLRNPNGDWSIGGFNADTGLTGRKLAVDNYGPNIPLGGGCFSGKDATKVDRSGAYFSRRIAVDYLKKRKAHEVYVHIAYAIGVAEPTMATVTIDGRQEPIRGYDLRPKSIIKSLKLRRPQFRETAKYGHFGNGFEWDK